MTPGFAKPRSELPWLPYEEQDRVIINAHNFTPAAFDPSVNGKTPNSVWCPTRDTDGRNTLALTDLVGTADGTLSNMENADWINDIGSLWCLEFDGVNEFISFPTFSQARPYTISFWIRPASLGSDRRLFAPSAGSSSQLALRLDNGNLEVINAAVNAWLTLATGISAGAMVHVVVTSTTTATQAYINGTAQTAVGATLGVSASFAFGSRYSGFGNFFAGRLDDVRVFGSVLNASDVSFLYSSGSGRGKSA
jgi:hypothetical protein